LGGAFFFGGAVALPLPFLAAPPPAGDEAARFRLAPAPFSCPMGLSSSLLSSSAAAGFLAGLLFLGG